MPRCRNCNRQLTDPVSIKHGFGPECLKLAVKAKRAPVSALSEYADYRRSLKTVGDTLTMDLFEGGEG